jgi:pimeloyl-ACP methyl ester carboxylesterase
MLYLLVPLSVALALLVTFLIFCAIKYAPIIGRIFEEQPRFRPLRVPPAPDGEDVRFKTEDGLELAGSYFRERTGYRVGVLVFCHEFLSDRWSFQPYVDYLRDRGFDIFSFDFRNHGASDSDPGYNPLQWVSEHEVRDLRAAIGYLMSRPDCDPAGVGLFGVSRGGGSALVAAADEPRVWGVVTDGAFPTRGTTLAYVLRWAEIYVTVQFLWKKMPLCVFRFVAWAGRVYSERRLRRRFPDVERSAARLTPRPWLMIHGENDTYIGTEIARPFFDQARDPKEIWIVPGAKHNKCREVEPEAYVSRVGDFLARFAPRRPLPAECVAEHTASWRSDAPPLTLRNAGEPSVEATVQESLAAPVSR